MKYSQLIAEIRRALNAPPRVAKRSRRLDPEEKLRRQFHRELLRQMKKLLSQR